MRALEYGLMLALVLVGAGCSSQNTETAEKKGKGAEKQGKGPLTVRTAKVDMRQIRRTIESIGTFFPYDETVVSAEIDGKAEKINADLGDTVQAGQVLVQISDEEQRYLLAQNEAQMRQALERLGLKEENEKVADILQTPDVRRARADLTDAEQQYRRQRALADQGIGAASDRDQSLARQQAAQAAYDATLNQTRNLVQDVERVRAIVELQRKKLRDTSVRAPFAGQVKERAVTQGQFVRANAALFTLVKVNPLRLRIEIPERMAPWTRNGQIVEVEVEAFPERMFTGKIWRISPTVDQSKRTFVAEALIDNPRGELKAGSYAKARIATQKVDQIMVVPDRAVAYVLGVNKAFVVSAAGEVEAREVKIGDRQDGSVEILEGLAQGEMVATTQTQRLDTGLTVGIAAGDEPGEGFRKKGGKGAKQDAAASPETAPGASPAAGGRKGGKGKRGS